jgi:hypothetical protein
LVPQKKGESMRISKGQASRFKALWVCLVVLLVGCGQSLTGTFSDEFGATKYTFGARGKVYVSALGIETELKYEVNGNRVRIDAPQGNIVFTIESETLLVGPLGIKFYRR